MSALFCGIKNYLKKFFLAWNLGAPALGGPLDFVHPAHPVVAPLTTTVTQMLSIRGEGPDIYIYIYMHLYRINCSLKNKRFKKQRKKNVSNVY